MKNEKKIEKNQMKNENNEQMLMRNEKDASQIAGRGQLVTVLLDGNAQMNRIAGEAVRNVRLGQESDVVHRVEVAAGESEIHAVVGLQVVCNANAHVVQNSG